MQIILDNSDKLLAILLLITISITLRLVLEFLGQRWITTTAHTSTLVFLPILTYVITKVISGNIALSLGMVGALSIVRFRNPVRSPLELSVYFCAITMGIAASVNLKWLIFLVVSIFFAVLILIFVNSCSEKFFKKSFFNTSFSEGNSLSNLEITSLKEIDLLDNCKYLKIKKNLNNNITYILVSNDFNKLKILLDKIKTNENVKDYQLNQ